MFELEDLTGCGTGSLLVCLHFKRFDFYISVYPFQHLSEDRL